MSGNSTVFLTGTKMSFKRDGDDKSLMKNLNDQRVRELLGSHVPQDEAKLLSNGRLTCTICIHRPVFDTINMLANHRRGKRHLSELSKYIKCKEDIERKAMLRKQDQASSSLGHKHVASKQSRLKNQRKPILEVASKVKLPDSSSQNNPEKKALTTVKHYLKKMARKTSLEKVVERNRENYGIDLQKNIQEQSLLKPSSKSEQYLPQLQERSTSKSVEIQEYETKLRMTGWIKDSEGKWIKDPDVEFDSDEDDPPPPP